MTMSDNKEYLTRQVETGSINISEDVIAIIALEAMAGVEGIGGISNVHGKDISELLSRKNAAKGVKVCVEDSAITIDTFIKLKYGFSVNDVATRIQNEVFDAIESMTGFSVSAVNVHVTGVAMGKEK